MFEAKDGTKEVSLWLKEKVTEKICGKNRYLKIGAVTEHNSHKRSQMYSPVSEYKKVLYLHVSVVLTSKCCTHK